MSTRKYSAPLPRGPLQNPDLYRPDHFTAEPRPDSVLGLDRGECIDPEFTAIAADILKSLPDSLIYSYPTSGPLYRRLARYLDLPADRLLLTAGSDGAIKAVFETLVEPGDRVLMPDPTYQMYGVYCQVFGAAPVLVPYETRADGPYLSADAMIAAIAAHRPKLVCQPNPDNPTGFAFGETDLRRMVEAAGEVGAAILVDEAYHPFEDITALPWVEEYGHLIVARTFSKAWGLAGIRLGHIAAAPELVAELHKSRPMIEAGGVAMALVERLLDHEGEMRASLARLKEGRAWFTAEMKKLGFDAIETSGNFVHVDFGPARDAVCAALDGKVRYRVFGGACLENYLRFTTTTIALFEPVVALIREAAESTPHE